MTTPHPSAIEAFEILDIRVGTILEAQPFPQARKPAYKLKVDFGHEIGVKNSSAQITHHYDVCSLPGKKVLAVVNFPAKRIAGFASEVLVLGVPDDEGHIVLVEPPQPLRNGARLL
ncbi:MAG: tRNA-binding protein [Vulcanimicrobiaceae bacterium]